MGDVQIVTRFASYVGASLATRVLIMENNKSFQLRVSAKQHLMARREHTSLDYD
jgi:hypothetical protein